MCYHIFIYAIDFDNCRRYIFEGETQEINGNNRNWSGNGSAVFVGNDVFLTVVIAKVAAETHDIQRLLCFLQLNQHLLEVAVFAPDYCIEIETENSYPPRCFGKCFLWPNIQVDYLFSQDSRE